MRPICREQFLTVPTALPRNRNRDRMPKLVPWEANARKGTEFAQRLHHELEARDHKSCQSVEGTRPRDTPAFSAMANGQIKAAGTADHRTRIGCSKQLGLVTGAGKTEMIALVVHDGKKADMVAFVKNHVDQLNQFQLIGTGTTANHVESVGLSITTVLSGPLGGDAQIVAEVACHRVKAVFFFRDPLGKHPHDPDISMLMRICDVHNIPLTTNVATAELILTGISGEN